VEKNNGIKSRSWYKEVHVMRRMNNSDREKREILAIVQKYYPDIIAVATALRKKLESMYGTGTELAGKCIMASEALCKELTKRGYKCKTVEGWCWYDTCDNITNEPTDAHTWVQVYGLSKLGNRVLYVDITGDQFNPYLDYPLEGVEIGRIPYCMHKGKPSREHLRYIGWYD